MIWIHRYTRLLVASTLLLLTAGGMVTSTNSGLAVPDWPTTYGYNMFTFPLSKMVGGIFYEHGHRLIASIVGMLTIGLVVWLWRVESRRWVKRLGLIALGAVILQGLLGGLTVMYFLPDPVSIGHAGLAQVFFGLTVALALVTSRGWRTPSTAPVDDDGLRRRAVALTVLVYVQILIGATMRHTGAGLAIPDFPLAFGGLIPPTWTADIAVHYVHRVGAVCVTIWALMTATYVWRRHGDHRELTRPMGLLLTAIALQITLGAVVVLTGKHPIVNTLHVAGGAIVLVTSLTLALRAFRARIDVAGATPSRVAPGFGAARPVRQT